MGKILVVFLCVFIVIVCGSSGQNLQSNSTKKIPQESWKKMKELEEFREEFDQMKSSLVDLSVAVMEFSQSLKVNETGKPEKSGETGITGTTERASSPTPSPRQPSKTPVPQSKTITSCSVVMETLPSPRSKKQAIYPHGNRTSLEVLCDFENDGGGWTTIQKRASGPQGEFNRDWNDYKNGFGSLSGNFWLGLDNIYALTKNGDQELRIELEDFEGERRFVKYSSFSISDASDFYRLTIGGFSRDSTAADSILIHNGTGEQFTTRDSSRHSETNFASLWSAGGWWFPSWGGAAMLNGLYWEKEETVPFGEGVIWSEWKGPEYSLAKTEMKIRTRKP